MRHTRAAFSALVIFWMSSVPAASLDTDLNRIIDEGFNRSEIVDTTLYLTDRIGARLTNSPQMRQAETWTFDKFQQWGLSNVRKEGFTFGRGWSAQAWYVTMLEPRMLQLATMPVAWTPGIEDQVTAPVIWAPMTKVDDFATWRGKLAGKIVLIDPPAEVVALNADPAWRYSDEELTARSVMPPTPADSSQGMLDRMEFPSKLDAFLKAEAAIAWISRSYRDRKVLHGVGTGFRLGKTPSVPALEMAAEDYRRLVRLARGGESPVLRIRDVVQFHDEDPNAYNILADIPGSDPKAGYIMAGAHFDSWAAGDGAMDNAAGTAIVMEAARILSKLKVKPRRTIRFALFNGEEQGLLGSRAYVDRHIASRPGMTLNGGGAVRETVPDGVSQAWPIAKRPGYSDLKMYFNLDSGGGRIRGLVAQGNLAAIPKLKAWLEPLKAMGASTVAAGVAGGSDSTSFVMVGAPTTTFISDMHDALTTHHTNIDTFDHLGPEDLRQAAVVVASLLLRAANDPETLPTMPVPSEVPARIAPFLEPPT